MGDIVDKITRSRMMAGIRGKDTRPELNLRRALHRLGLRYRVHATDLPGRPDIVLPRHRATILVHGCFWHRHKGCAFATTPATNARFWNTKFDQTVERDERNVAALQHLGWRLAVVWECALKQKGAEAVAGQIAAWLASDGPFKEIGSENCEPAKSKKSRRLTPSLKDEF
ncbi:DNA mismatch endonuclease Vsr [Bradyrhizobium sp. CER78]|uniref:very short patch repair endonuclease n=1 Tax=Bradyrhizobium sp. CER78 TaxID=3039162 RepID=UPI002447780C|nr:DNA mismatch endonuclease Vsr [Bradyrhizobium sp. CER78]MDH2382840.1 DNA mismatch endonuclease Vsr [Bradyrhizobium sp. CER78]